MTLKNLGKRLFEASSEIANDVREITNLSRGQKAWLVGGVGVYIAPAIFRAITKVTEIFPHFYDLPWFLPTNVIEKVLVNSIFPGATSSVVIGDTKWGKYRSFIKSLSKKLGLEKYERFVGRFTGAAIGALAWTAIQYVGYSQSYLWPHGGNAFEDPSVYPFNIAIGLVSSIVPYAMDKVKSYFLSHMKPYSLMPYIPESDSMISDAAKK